MKSLTEFLETNCDLQEEEMKTLSGGSDLSGAASNLAAGTITGICGEPEQPTYTPPLILSPAGLYHEQTPC